MSTLPPISATVPTANHTAESAVAPPVAASADRLIWTGTIAAAAVLFALLANSHWVPGGDSEVYVATARNILLRHFSFRGFRFNGQPMNMVPPGWPYVLAVAMKVSTSFLFLKLIALTSMLGSLALAYPICRRFAPPVVCGAAVLMTALLSHVYPLTFWLHSDALFCLLSTASFLVAIQIGEGRTQGWRIALLCVLCIAAVTVRWAGLLGWFVVAAAVMDSHGDPVDRRWLTSAYWRELLARANRWFGSPRFTRTTLALVLATATTFGTFGAWRIILSVSASQAKLIKEAGGAEDTGLEARADPMTSRGYGWLNAGEEGWRGYVARTIGWGDWYSFLFWQPFRFHVMTLVNLVGRVCGWLVLAPLLILAAHGLPRRRWIWSGLAIYGFLLAMSWPHPNARYLVPIAFFLLTGIWTGSQLVAQCYPWTTAWLLTALALFVASFIVCNGALYGIEVWAQRSSDFYGTYEAGLNKDLIASGFWLGTHHLEKKDGIAVSERYVNLSTRVRTSKLGLRVITMLTGRPIITIPKKYMKGPSTQPTTAPATTSTVATNVPSVAIALAPTTQQDFLYDPDPVSNPPFLAWARSVDIKYYLYQPPVSPWRALHFRVAWLQEHATHEKATDTGAGWRLYRIPDTGDSALRLLPLPHIGDWPTHVPGI